MSTSPPASPPSPPSTTRIIWPGRSKPSWPNANAWPSELSTFPWLTVYPSAFQLPALPRHSGIDAAQLKADLAQKHGIFIRYFNKPGLTDCIRISVGKPEQTEMPCLQTALKGHEDNMNDFLPAIPLPATGATASPPTCWPPNAPAARKISPSPWSKWMWTVSSISTNTNRSRPTPSWKAPA